MPLQITDAYTIEGDGSTTEVINYNLTENGRDILITSSVTTVPDSRTDVTVTTWWDNGTAVGSSMVIDDRSGDLSGGYSSDHGGSFEPITIIGSSGGRMLPPEEFNLPQ
jgi:hypothetical protein